MQPMTRWLWILTLVASLLLAWAAVPATAQDDEPSADPPDAPAQPADEATDDTGDDTADEGVPDGAEAAIEDLLQRLATALARQDAPALWALMDPLSQQLVTNQLAALQEVVAAVPEELRDASPSGWAEGDTLASLVDATPQDLLAIWMRSDRGRLVIADLENMGRVLSMRAVDDGREVRFTLDGTAVSPPSVILRTADGWRLRFLR